MQYSCLPVVEVIWIAVILQVIVRSEKRRKEEYDTVAVHWRA